MLITFFVRRAGFGRQGHVYGIVPLIYGMKFSYHFGIKKSGAEKKIRDFFIPYGIKKKLKVREN